MKIDIIFFILKVFGFFVRLMANKKPQFYFEQILRIVIIYLLVSSHTPGYRLNRSFKAKYCKIRIDLFARIEFRIRLIF